MSMPCKVEAALARPIGDGRRRPSRASPARRSAPRPMVSSRWRAMRLLLNLLVSRTISPSVRESKLSNGCASGGGGSTRILPVNSPPDFAPQFDEGAERVCRRLEQHARETALRAVPRIRQPLNTTRSQRSDSTLKSTRSAAALQRPADEGNAIFDREIRGRRGRDDLDASDCPRSARRETRSTGNSPSMRPAAAL